MFSGTCGKSNHTQLTVEQFFKHGKKCKDKLNICKQVGDLNHGMLLTFDSRYPGTIPAGYFCMWNVPNENEDYMFTYINRAGVGKELINQAVYNFYEARAQQLEWYYYDNNYLVKTNEK